MPNLLPEEVAKQIKVMLSEMKDPISIVFFTDNKCNSCSETQKLLEEIAVLNPKITFVAKNIAKDLEDVKRYDIQRVPSFVLLDKNQLYKGVKFSGIPAGHEINSFLSAVMLMSGLTAELSPEQTKRIDAIKKPVDIKVFVTLGCPHCPGAVQTAHFLATKNANVKGEMIEAQTFQDLSQKYHVSGVPKIVINEKYELLGNQPLEEFLKVIESL